MFICVCAVTLLLDVCCVCAAFANECVRMCTGGQGGQMPRKWHLSPVLLFTKFLSCFVFFSGALYCSLLCCVVFVLCVSLNGRKTFGSPQVLFCWPRLSETSAYSVGQWCLYVYVLWPCCWMFAAYVLRSQMSGCEFLAWSAIFSMYASRGATK